MKHVSLTPVELPSHVLGTDDQDRKEAELGGQWNYPSGIYGVALTSLVTELDGPKPFWPITCFLINYTFIMFLKQYSTGGVNCELSYSGGKEAHFAMVNPNAQTVAGLKRTQVLGNKRKATIQKINNCRF